VTAPPVSRDDLISRTAAAAQLGIHVNTLDREARRAGLRRFRVRGDNRIFFLRAEIDAHADPIIEIVGTAPATSGGGPEDSPLLAAGAAMPTDTTGDGDGTA
jgi:hypothetical protein